MANEDLDFDVGGGDTHHAFLSELFKPIRDLAKNFDIDLSTILTKYSEEVLNSCDEEDAFRSINFTEAALVIQGSASIYGKKVEFLFNLASKLLQFLNDEKKKSSASDKRKDKDVLVAGRHNNDDFVANDDIKYLPDAHKLNEDFSTAHRRYVQTFLSRTPLALITLSEAEKGDTSLMTKTGEVFGNRNDYNMNICRRDEYDFLSLPTLNCAFLNEISSEDISHASVSSLSSRMGNLSCAGDFVASDESMHVDFQVPGDNLLADANAPPESAPDNAIASAPNTGAEDAQDDDCVIHEDPIFDEEPADLPSENPLPPIPEIDNAETESVSGARRSTRQSQKLEQEKATKAEERKKAWSREEDKSKDIVVPAQKCERKSTRKRRRKNYSRDSKCPEVVNEKMNRGRKGLDIQKVTLDSKTLKKMPPAKDITVNEAFELLFTNNYHDEKEVATQLRQQLQNNCAASPDDGLAPLDDLAIDPDDDYDVNDNDPLPDINDDIGDAAADCFSPDSDLCTPFSQPLLSPRQEDLSFEGILRNHVELYMKEADKYMENTELSENLKRWEERIRPILEEEAKRESFDIHLYGTRILDKFENNNRKQTIKFTTAVEGKTPWEISRCFLATLVLANNNNVEISSKKLDSGMDDIDLTLLSRKRHQEKLDAFGHGSGEHT